MHSEQQQQQQPPPLTRCSAVPARPDWPPLASSSAHGLSFNLLSQPSPAKQRTDLAPRTLKQISLTINTLRSSTTRSLSLHQHLNVIHPLSSTRYRPVTSFGRHMCHVATSRCSHALSRMTLSHSYSLAIPTCFSLSLLIFQPHPPVIINTTPSMSLCLVDADATSRSPPVTHAFTYNICSPVFTHTHVCRSHSRAVSHTSFCARWTWAGIQPDAPHSHSFKTFLATFRMSVLNVMQSKEEKTGLGRF